MKLHFYIVAHSDEYMNGGRLSRKINREVKQYLKINGVDSSLIKDLGLGATGGFSLFTIALKAFSFLQQFLPSHYRTVADMHKPGLLIVIAETYTEHSFNEYCIPGWKMKTLMRHGQFINDYLARMYPDFSISYMYRMSFPKFDYDLIMEIDTKYNKKYWIGLAFDFVNNINIKNHALEIIKIQNLLFKQIVNIKDSHTYIYYLLPFDHAITFTKKKSQIQKAAGAFQSLYVPQDRPLG